MCCKGFLKRAVPFFLTFCIGILIAGIFIPISGPNFQFKKRGWQNHRERHERMDTEIQRLREENEFLKKVLKENKVGYGRGDGRGSGDGIGTGEGIGRGEGGYVELEVTEPVPASKK